MNLSDKEKEAIQERLINEGPKRWYHTLEVIPGSGIFTEGDRNPLNFENRLRGLGVDSEWLEGKRVLDIGTYTGAYAFYLEECGAEVVAIDVQRPETTGFKLLHELRGSKIDFRLQSIYDLNPEDFGYFDLVSFFGVFYHLKHPILALERINSICKEGSILLCGGTSCDTWMHDDDPGCSNGANFSEIHGSDVDNPQKMTIECLNDMPISGFAARQFYGDRTNWFIPNYKCMEGWLRRTGFRIRQGAVNSVVMPRAWNKTGIKRSAITCSAEYVGSPELEYGNDDYQMRYSSEQANTDLYQFQIPVQSQVQKLEAHIKELEEEIAKHNLD